ncbi:hypothetical protein B8W68_03965, partial [Mycobacterium paraintracellulare]
MKIREMIARSLLVGSLAGAALGLGAGVAAADPPPPPPPHPPARGRREFFYFSSFVHRDLHQRLGDQAQRARLL